MSPSIIFTCAHVFAPLENEDFYEIEVFEDHNDVFDESKPLKAQRLEIPLDAANLLEDWHCFTSYQLPHYGQELDFAVIGLERPLQRPIGSFLNMLSSSLVPNKSLQDGTVVCGFGLPIQPSGDVSSANYFPGSLSSLIRGELESLAEPFLDDLMKVSLFDFNHPLAAFGSIRRFTSDNGEAYVYTSSSTFKGLSGGPVVGLDDPDTLLGINIGGTAGASSALFLRMDSPLILKVFEIYVKSQ